MVEVLQAADGSVNFIDRLSQTEAFESRYVVRDETELICYLSSQVGCKRACRMCHLTQTGQTSNVDATLSEFAAQAARVFQHARQQENEFGVVNYNFMARGEPLENPNVSHTLLHELAKVAMANGMKPRFKISTIMPTDCDLDLVCRFPIIQPDIYYSLYGIDPDFRRKWFPRAVDPTIAMRHLDRWQQHSHKIPRIHLAFIKGENDSLHDVERLCAFIERTGIRFDFNIVRYNPYDHKSAEGDWERAQQQIREWFPASDINVIQRVGYEAKASCGMFVS